MRAARIDAPGSIRVVDVPAPVPGPGEVVIDVAYAGICGSDVEIFDGSRPAAFVRYPVTPGHEWSGTVARIGRGVDEALIGRKVVGEGFHACGTCARCRSGDPTLCGTYDETGFTRPGAWAEQLLLPATHLHVLPDGADLLAAAGLEPAACAAEAVGRAGHLEGQRVAIIGGGAIGLLATQLLSAVRPVELVVVEPNARRAELALQLGATGTEHPDEAQCCPDRFDTILEAAGAPQAAQLAVSLARRGGRIVFIGIPAEASPIDARDIVAKRLMLDAVFGASPAAWTDAIQAFKSGLLDPAPLVTHVLDLAAIGHAVQLIASRDDRVGKVLIRSQPEGTT